MPGDARAAVMLTQCWHSVPGGTARSVLRLVEALVAVGTVDLVGVGPRGPAPDPVWAPPVPVVRASLPLPVLYDAWHLLRRPRLPGALGPVDLVHVTAPVVPPTGRTPMVATVHDLFPVTRPELLTARGARLMRRGLELVRDEAAAVMVPSEAVAADCQAFGIDAARLRVVPWGVDPVEPSDEDVDRVRARYGVVGPYVLFVGTLEPRKNLARLVDAAGRLDRPGTTLVLVGPGGWGGPVPAGTDVVTTGFVPQEDLAPLMAGAAAFCFPSLAEGFGLPVLEAMAAGAAVVTSAETACAEVAGDGAVLVDPTDTDAIAGALADLLHDTDGAAGLRARARARAARFTWSDAAARTLDTYRAVAG